MVDVHIKHGQVSNKVSICTNKPHEPKACTLNTLIQTVSTIIGSLWCHRVQISLIWSSQPPELNLPAVKTRNVLTTRGQLLATNRLLFFHYRVWGFITRLHWSAGDVTLATPISYPVCGSYILFTRGSQSEQRWLKRRIKVLQPGNHARLGLQKLLL